MSAIAVPITTEVKRLSIESQHSVSGENEFNGDVPERPATARARSSVRPGYGRAATLREIALRRGGLVSISRDEIDSRILHNT